MTIRSTHLRLGQMSYACVFVDLFQQDIGPLLRLSMGNKTCHVSFNHAILYYYSSKSYPKAQNGFLMSSIYVLKTNVIGSSTVHRHIFGVNAVYHVLDLSYMMYLSTFL